MHDRRIHISEQLTEQLETMGRNVHVLVNSHFNPKNIAQDSKDYIKDFRGHATKLHLLITQARNLASDILWSNSKQPSSELEHGMTWLRMLGEKIIDIEPRHFIASLNSPKSKAVKRNSSQGQEGSSR